MQTSGAKAGFLNSQSGVVKGVKVCLDRKSSDHDLPLTPQSGVVKGTKAAVDESVNDAQTISKANVSVKVTTSSDEMIKRKKSNQYTAMPVKTRDQMDDDRVADDMVKPRSKSLFANFFGPLKTPQQRRQSSPAEIPEAPPGGDFVGAQITEEAIKTIQQFGKKS